MLETLLVFAVGITPPLLSVWFMRKAEASASARLRSAQEIPMIRIPQRHPLPNDRHYVEGVGEVTGDVTCRFNARSAYLRCAVNPEGPCKGCSHYQPTDSR
ncbi:DUF6464 family protein [Phormidium sp. CCY1219]|uniref:DUF6464 family protein n=1 Tax=Phormidium sp. CCY1219 TaxID=2886104 RepID=UPI002D1F944B|nr:DUF6464 family protein [Phormidium sp. CCY1219]MEB3828035.1 DUF6464 family protein [Phormidium sp. CCY1219]